MNTYKTLRGIEFDLEITELGHKEIQVQATCEEGSNTFTIDFPYPIKEDNTFYGELLEGDCKQLTEDDLPEVMAWVDEVTIGFIASEVAKVCLKKSSDTEYWCFDLFHKDYISMHVCRMKVINTTGFESLENFFANGETEIKELINKLK